MPKQISTIPKLKRYKIVRIIREEFEVSAQNKDEAKLNIENPHTVTVVRETIKLDKS